MINLKNISSILFLLAFPILLSGQTDISGSIQHDGGSRTYNLYIPAIYDGTVPVPIVFYFHALTSSNGPGLPWEMKVIADTANFIFVKPQGLENDKGQTHWSVGNGIGSSVDDVGFVSNLIDSIASDYNIDTSRIYATGFSNGGLMSFHLAGQLSEKIAAIASVAGGMTLDSYNDCNPKRPVPILYIHGTLDDGILYEGGGDYKAVNDVLDYWVDYNNCNTVPTITHYPGIDETDDITIDSIVYAEGDSNVCVKHLKVNGGGHTWNGLDINTTVEIWKFVSNYKLTRLPSSEAKITAIEFEEITGEEVVVIDDNSNIISTGYCDQGVDLTNLTPEITLSEGATISPLSGIPQDFSLPVTYVVTAEDGTTKKWAISVELYICDGIEEPGSLPVTIYPNPAPSDVNIDLSALNGETSVSVHNTSGICVYTERCMTGDMITISGLESGIYFVRVFNNGQIGIKKLVIE